MCFSFFLWATRVSVCTIALCIASIWDIRHREIPDRVWAISTPVNLVLLIWELMLDPSDLPLVLISISITCLTSLLIYYSGLAGGADAKALALMAVSCPINRHEPLFSSHPFVPMMAFSNALLFSISSSLLILMKNLAWKLRTKRPLFEGLEAPPVVKILALLSGYKIRLKDLPKTKFVFPMEVFIEEDGRVRRKLGLVVKVGDYADLEGLLRSGVDLPDYIWVSPGLPMVVFLTAGFVSAITLGDLLFHLLFSLLKLILPFQG